MLSVLAITAPTFGLMLVGYGAARLKLFGDVVAEGLSAYVFVLAIPCLLMRTILKAPIPDEQPWGYWISYFAGAGIAWTLATLGARRLFARDKREAVIFGFSAGYGNVSLIGVPLILGTVGVDAATPLALLLVIHLPLMTVTVSLLLGGTGEEGFGGVGRSVLRTLATNPILIGIYLGFALRAAGGETFGPLAELIDLVAGSATPCALIGMGLALSRYGIDREWRAAGVISALKLVAHPAVAFVLSWYVFDMPAAWSAVCVLFASCPSGVNAHLLAMREGTGSGAASAAISLSTVLAAATIPLWLALVAV